MKSKNGRTPKRAPGGRKAKPSKAPVRAEKSETGIRDGRDLDLQKIFRLLQAHSSVDFSRYKQSTVGRRIQRHMRTHGFETAAAYLKFLQEDPGAVKELADEMFIHVTEFFRDPESFRELSKKVFPLLVKNRVAGAPIRIWVPGCSTGEEAYSIAISLLEFLGPDATTTPLQIFATDISETSVKKARAGIYEKTAGLSTDRQKKFFDKTKDGFRVKKIIRDHCIFSRHDVANSPPFAKIDLLSCRNLLIYFAQDLQKQVMPVFHYALNPEGFLWLGKSEAPTGFSKLFALVDKTHKIYSKINLPTPLNYKFPSSKPLTESAYPAKRAPNHYAASIDSQKEFDRIVFSRYAPAGVMIDGNFDIIQVRGRTSPFIELPSGQPSHNLFKIVKRELLPGLRMAVQMAMKRNEAIRKEGLSYELGSERFKVNIEVIPVNVQSAPEDRQFLVLFEDAPKLKKAEQPESAPPPAAVDGADAKETYVRTLLEEIDSMREYQQSLSEGYEASQEELTSANEELQSANEELQSTNEEVETAKEELQAANEELTTLNEELQDRNSELVGLNEQLALSEERFRLLVTGVKDYAIFLLDPEGRIATWNEGARRFKGYEADEIIGKHFSIFYPKEGVNAGHPDRELKIAKAEGTYEEEGWRVRKEGSKFWANVVITRITDKNGKLLGFSKITRDLTERKKMEDELRKSHDELELRVQERTEELSSALASRDEFLSIASHELKTPITGLKLQFQMDKRKLTRSPSELPTREDLIASYDLAIKQINSLTNLVDDLLDTSRIQTGNFTLTFDEVDLSALATEVINRFAQQLKTAGCSLKVNCALPITGTWDRLRLQQVIVNLISNAIKYAPGTEIEISTAKGNEKATLCVQDSGPGIPKNLQPRIFDRFERAKADKNVGGLGLGLFIVRKIVEAHQGTVRVESEEGRGAKFVVDLPTNPSPFGANP